MANKTITQLDAAQSLNDNMVIAVQDTNTTHKTTLADVKAYCGGGGGGGSSLKMSDFYKLVLEDTYALEPGVDIDSFVDGLLKINSLALGSGAVTLKAPTYTFEHTPFGDPDEHGDRHATGTVTVLFEDGSKLEKSNIDFSYTGRRRIPNGLMLSTKSFVDTGIRMNGAYTFRVTGRTQPGFQAVLVGAYGSNQVRTTARILAVSQKLQAMWPGNVEITQGVSGIDYTQMFTYTIDYSHIEMRQGDVVYSRPISGDNTLSSGLPILMFNESEGGDFYHGVVSEVEIFDESGTLLKHFQSWIWDGEYVMVDIANNNTIYRPAQGELLLP